MNLAALNYRVERLTYWSGFWMGFSVGTLLMIVIFYVASIFR